MNETLINQTLPTMSLQSSIKPNFLIPDDLKNKWTILYFYPKDDTPGCTAQACSYRDEIEAFSTLKAQVIGVSSDDMKSHNDFVAKFSLNFPLLTDPEQELQEFLQVRSRDTFLIDPDGKIKRIWRNVSPRTTVAETRLGLLEEQSRY